MSQYRTNGVHYSAADRKWRYAIDGKSSRDAWIEKEECAKAYVTAYLDRNPKYKAVVDGKTWKEIFSIFQINMDPPDMQY